MGRNRWINADHPNENKQRLLSKGCSSKGLRHHHLDLAESPRQAAECKSCTVEKGRISGMSRLDVVGWEIWSQVNEK